MERQFSVNEAAASLIGHTVIPQAEQLQIGINRLRSGATVLDFGVHRKGGFRAGKYFAEIGMGGLGELTYGSMKLQNRLTPSVRITVKAPAICEVSSHVAYWKLNWRGRTVVISGPVRAIRGADKFARAIPYRDSGARQAVACIQTEELPDEELCALISEGVGIPPENLYVLAARTGCMAGAVQVCARNVEQSLPTVLDRGFPMEHIVEATATTPLVSVVDDEAIAYGRVNDCLIYGQESNLYVRCADEEIARMLDDIPFSKNGGVYGVPFFELFGRCGNSWANVPREWDAPCKINFINLTTGTVFSTGRVNATVLEQSFMGGQGVVL